MTTIDITIFKLRILNSWKEIWMLPRTLIYIVCFLARVATSGECLRGEGLVRLIGAVVCLLAA